MDPQVTRHDTADSVPSWPPEPHQLMRPSGKTVYGPHLVHAPRLASVAIDDDFKRDVRWFCEYARLTNRRTLIEPRLPLMAIECDACLAGPGAFSEQAYYSITFPLTYAANFHISQLEAINLVLAIKSLVPKDLRLARVVIKTDNWGARYALSTGKTRDPILSACARETWLLSALQELDILIVHAPGDTLILADALSRSHFNPQLEATARALVCKMKLSCVLPAPLHHVLTLTI